MRATTAPVVARDVYGIYAPRDPAPVSFGGVWLGGWYVACGGGGAKTPVIESCYAAVAGGNEGVSKLPCRGIR
jgi:hypothetical protein